MKKNTIEKIEKEINEKTKLPIIVITYFIFITLGSINTIKSTRSVDLNIFSFLFLAIAIILFEIAYRKEKGNIAIYGIEFLTIAIFNLFLPYIIFELDENYKRNYLLATSFIAIYYTLKSIYMSIRIKSKYMENISDVKEIVKKEKTTNRTYEDIEEIEESKGDKTKEQKKRGRPRKVVKK